MIVNFGLHVAQQKRSAPAEYYENTTLRTAIDMYLPSNYSFEIEKTLWRIDKEGFTHVGLQFPEGLLIYSIQIATLIETFSKKHIDVTIFGDVTYGACCIDDFTAKAINIDFLVHYGHSCLIPIQHTNLSCLYVFVEIKIDIEYLISLLLQSYPVNCLLTFALFGTVQYSSAVYALKKRLSNLYGEHRIIVAQVEPLSAGEVLGCTSPKLKLESHENCIGVFLADGRFHLESAMIQNPKITFLRFDPFTKILLREYYAHDRQHHLRYQAIQKAKLSEDIGIILSTLGRQGSPGIYDRIQQLPGLEKKNRTLFLMSEITKEKLSKFALCIDTFIQVGCPRLSIDWGYEFAEEKVVLSPYEAYVAFNNSEYLDVYPMDFYSKVGGQWTNFAKGYSRSGKLLIESSEVTLNNRRHLLRLKAQQKRELLAPNVNISKV